MHLRVHWLLLIVMGVLAAGPSRGAESPWAVEFNGARGLSVAYRGVPIIRQSTLYVVKPGWTGLHYDQRSQRHEVRSNGAERLVVGANGVFRAEYRIAPLDDRRLRLTFEGRLLQDVPAEIEYAAGYFNANLIANRPFRATLSEGERHGTVPAFPTGTDQAANDLAPGFRRLELDSRIGRLTVDVEADQRVAFFDARREAQDWARAAPVFWCGLGSPARKLTYGKSVRLELTLTLDPIAQPQRPVVTTAPRLHPAAQALAPVERPLLVIPQPKRMSAGTGSCRVTADTTWSLSGPKGVERVAEALARALRDAGASRVKRDVTVLSDPNAPVVVRLGGSDGRRVGVRGRGPTLRASSSRKRETASGAGSGARDRQGERGLPPGPPPARKGESIHAADRVLAKRNVPVSWRTHPEGYRLAIGEKGIEILASTPQGAFYGVQTLAQLLRPAQGGAAVPAVTIEDCPSLRFRGAHWFPSAKGVPFHRKLIERVMARYKLNHAVIQCEAARWDSHPEIAAPASISKADLRGLVELARKHFIEPVPLINTPGHAEWMFRNGKNRHFAEDPEKAYAYCVNHPEADRFIQEIVTEALEVFRPRLFHLGHDEVTMLGRFPNPECPRCRGRSVTELVLQHAQRLSGWLKERGVGSMIWGDMLLAKGEVPDAAHAPSVEEARRRRAGLPPGTMVADWHYGAGERYPSLGLLKEAGLRTVASTWYEPQNVYHFARAARENGSEGLLQTTWAGYFPDESVLESELRQFSAFILAAEYAWSGRAEPPARLPYDPGNELIRAYFDEGSALPPGWLVELTPAARTPRPDWVGLGPGWDLSRFPGGDQRLGGILFRVPKNELVVLGSAAAPKEAASEIRVAVGKKAAEVALLNAALWTVPTGAIAARMTVEYEDGTTADFPLVQGRTTASWTQDSPALHAPVAWRGKSPAGTPVSLRVTRWKNPHPQRKIRAVRFVPVDPEAGWCLAGLTLLE